MYFKTKYNKQDEVLDHLLKMDKYKYCLEVSIQSNKIILN